MNDPNTVKYLSDIDNMTKCVLKADDEATLRGLSEVVGPTHWCKSLLPFNRRP